MSDPRTELEKTLPDHLGGHLGNNHIDAAVLDYLIERYAVKSMLDIGCGPGAMVTLARDRGIDALGVDGDWTIDHDWIVHHDYTKCALHIGHMVDEVDLIWCFEFVEHVEAEYAENYLQTMDHGRVLYLTTPAPGFGGWHHVNEQPEEYWIALFGTHKWQQDTEATAWVRQHGDHVFSRRQGLVFVKNDRSSSQP